MRKKDLEKMSSTELLALTDGILSDGEILDHVLAWLDEDTLCAMLKDLLIDYDLVD